MEQQLLSQGEVVTLTNGRQYLIFATAVSADGKNYVYMMSEDKPIEVRFAEQTLVDGQLDLRTLSDRTEKLQALELFKQLYSK